MSATSWRVPLLVVVAAALLLSAIGRVLRDASLGLPLFSRITLPALGISIGLLIAIGVLRSITRRARARVRLLKASHPRSQLYSLAATPELQEFSAAIIGARPEVIDISSFPALKADANGISAWGDDAASSKPACAWALPWTAIGGTSDSMWSDHGIRHRAVRLELAGAGELALVLCHEDFGGFSAGKKATESFKATLRTNIDLANPNATHRTVTIEDGMR